MRKVVLTLALSWLCGIAVLHSQVFHEVGVTLGIAHAYGVGQDGGGISFHDFDGDGWDDITLATEAGYPIHFYKNMNGTFVKLTSPISNNYETKQVIWVDYDNDGDKDLFVTALNAPNLLYENTGGFSFTDVTASVGLPIVNKETFGAIWGDVNNDGWLDLYINNYEYSLVTNQLFLSAGNGTFIDISVPSGASDSTRLTLCSAFLDVNNDGYQDIHVSNDKTDRNALLLNNGNNTFTDIAVSAGTNIVVDAMSAAVGDFDNNGYLDVYVTNNPPGNKLMKNNGNLTFSEVAGAYGVIHNSACWGANFLDYDNDGDLDLYVSTSQIGGFSTQNQLYRNDSTTFNKHVGGFLGDTLESYSNAIGDYNNDGIADIAVLNAFVSNSQLWSTKTVTNNWIKVALQGTVSNRDGIGSWVEVYYGGKAIKRYTHCGIGYLAQNSGNVIIGLDTNTMVDSLIVRWLSGHVDKAYYLTANQKVLVVEGSAVDDKPKLNYDTSTVCSGDSVLLRLNETYTKYSWSNGDSTKSTYVKPPGYFYVTVVNKFGFGKTSDTIYLDAFPNTLQLNCSSVDESGEGKKDGMAIVETSGGTPSYSYLWNDAAKQKKDTARNLSTGKYKVIVTDEQGCFRKCYADVGVITGMKATADEKGLIIYPSPAGSMLQISMKGIDEQVLSVSIMDQTGRKIAAFKGKAPHLNVDVSSIPQGIYLVRIENDVQVYHRRIVISR